MYNDNVMITNDQGSIPKKISGKYTEKNIRARILTEHDSPGPRAVMHSEDPDQGSHAQ